MLTAELEYHPEIGCRSVFIVLNKIHESEFETYEIIVKLPKPSCNETDLHNCASISLEKISSYQKT